jgi:hypothetical protein
VEFLDLNIAALTSLPAVVLFTWNDIRAESGAECLPI